MPNTIDFSDKKSVANYLVQNGIPAREAEKVGSLQSSAFEKAKDKVSRAFRWDEVVAKRIPSQGNKMFVVNVQTGQMVPLE